MANPTDAQLDAALNTAYDKFFQAAMSQGLRAKQLPKNGSVTTATLGGESDQFLQV